MNRTVTRVSAIAALLVVSALPLRAQDDDEPEVSAFSFDRERVLGTSLHLEVHVLNDKVAARVEGNVLAEIERLRKVLSDWDDASELRQLAGKTEPVAASKELRTVLGECERWMAATKGAFQPGVELLTELWKSGAKRGTPPTDDELAVARARMPEHLWRIDDEKGTVQVLSDVPITIDALAKGFIIDRASEVARSEMVLVIGGDLRAAHGATALLDVVDPRAPADNAKALCKIQVTDAAVATSGGYARGFDIAGKHYSHIFDPHTGRPVERVLQATVVAPDAMTADALATILNVLAPADGLALIASLPKTQCLIIDAEGKQHASAGWAALIVPAANEKPALASALPGGGEVLVDFELGQAAADTGDRRRGGYKRPYVAVWIEDTEQHALRTLTLWVEKPKWISDLRRWSPLYEGRRDVIKAVTRATRAPGKYQVTWDGRDDGGAAVAPGKYVVWIEVVREHGTHQTLHQEVTLDGKEFHFDLPGGSEVASAAVSLRLSPLKQ